MESKPSVISIDVGTTSVKVVSFMETYEVIHTQSARISTTNAEQDPSEVYQAVTDTFCRVIMETVKQGYTIRNVGFSTAMHSIMVLSDTNQPLTNFITWLDTRAQVQAEKFWVSAFGKKAYQHTGTPVHPMSPLMKLLWMKSEKPELLHAYNRFISIKEWIWFQWFGEWVLDESMASATGLYNINNHTWSSGVLTYIGITQEQLSKVVPTTYTHKGTINEALLKAGVTQATVFNIGSSDGVLANLGEGVVNRDSMILTIGTSLAVRTTSPKPITDLETRNFCYILNDDKYVVGGPSNSGGVVLEWFIDKVLNRTDDFVQVVTKAGEQEIGSLFFLPYIYGERSPLWKPNAMATFIGLQEDNDAYQMTRAVVEGIFLNAYWIASGLFKEIGLPKRIYASGKLFHFDWIRQLVADIFNIPIISSDSVDASVLGASFLSNIAIGVETWESLATYTRPSAKIIEPQNHEAYVKKFIRFKEVCMNVN